MGIIVPKTLSFYRDGLAYSVSDVFVRNNSLHQSPQERLCLDWRVQMGQGIQFPVQECHSLYATEIVELTTFIYPAILMSTLSGGLNYRIILYY